MNINQSKTLLYRDLQGREYYKIDNGVITPANVFNATCSNGINKLTWSDSNDSTVIYNQSCMVNAVNSVVSIVDGPMNEIIGTKLTDLDVDCGNHPITYVNVNGTSNYATRKSTSTLQYSCGYNSTGSDVVTGNINVKRSNNVIDCGDKVLTSLKYRNINGPVIEYTCKDVYPNVTSNVSVNKQDIFNTTRSNYIKGFNIKTNSFDNPSVYWSQHDYADTLPSNRDEYTTAMDNDFFSVSCGNRGISGMQNNGKNIVYGCGDDELYNLHVQSYELPYDPVLNKYYDSGMLFDKVKCKDDEVLSSFHKTITPTGPAVKWVCGKLM